MAKLPWYMKDKDNSIIVNKWWVIMYKIKLYIQRHAALITVIICLTQFYDAHVLSLKYWITCFAVAIAAFWQGETINEKGQ